MKLEIKIYKMLDEHDQKSVIKDTKKWSEIKKSNGWNYITFENIVETSEPWQDNFESFLGITGIERSMNKKISGIMYKGEPELGGYFVSLGDPRSHILLQRVNHDFARKSVASMAVQKDVSKIMTITSKSLEDKTQFQESNVSSTKTFDQFIVKQPTTLVKSMKVKMDMADQGGTVVTAGSNIKLNIKKINDKFGVSDILDAFDKTFKSEKYKDNDAFSFIDKVSLVPADTVKNIIKYIESKEAMFDVAFHWPEPDSDGEITYRYAGAIYKDTHEVALAIEEEMKTSDVSKILNKKVKKFTDDEQVEKYVKNCINIDTNFENMRFLFNENNWYKISDDVVTEVENNYNSIPAWKGKKFTKWDRKDHPKELDYNGHISDTHEELDLYDQKFLQIKGKERIELCDLYDEKEKVAIHLKHYASASSISHVTRQAASSYFTSKNANELIAKFNKKHNLNFHGINTIVIALASEKKMIKGIPDITFLSKLAVNSLYKDLQMKNIKLYLANIEYKGAPPKENGK